MLPPLPDLQGGQLAVAAVAESLRPEEQADAHQVEPSEAAGNRASVVAERAEDMRLVVGPDIEALLAFVDTFLAAYPGAWLVASVDTERRSEACLDILAWDTPAWASAEAAAVERQPQVRPEPQRAVFLPFSRADERLRHHRRS